IDAPRRPVAALRRGRCRLTGNYTSHSAMCSRCDVRDGVRVWNTWNKPSILCSTARALPASILSCNSPLLLTEGVLMNVHVGLLLAALLAVSLSVRRGAAEDLFPDKNLEAAVRQEVFEKRNKPDPLVEADVVNISQVIGKGKKITNLKGLEKCKSV